MNIVSILFGSLFLLIKLGLAPDSSQVESFLQSAFAETMCEMSCSVSTRWLSESRMNFGRCEE